MGFRDLRDVFDPDLYLPIGGKTYRIPAPTMEQAARLKLLVLVEMTDEQEHAEIDELLGAVRDELFADGVKWPEFTHLGRTALLWAGAGDVIAEAHWHMAQAPRYVDLDKLKESTTNREARRAARKSAVKAPAKRAPRKAAEKKAG